MDTKRILQAVTSLFAIVMLTACSGGGGGGGGSTPHPTYTIGGQVSGLSGSGLMLQDNSGDDLPISGNGSFTFTMPVSNYAVSVKTHPSNPNQLCTVKNGSGTAASNVTTVQVDCVNAYTVGGSVSGLSGSGFVLQDNGGDDLPISSNGSFIFKTPVVTTYAVTVKTQPSKPSQTCTVNGGMGTVPGANVTSVTLVCSPWTKQMGVSGVDTTASSVATDANKNIFVAGSTRGGLDGNTLTGFADMFVTKYDAIGNKIYTKQMGVANGLSTSATSVATDTSGNVYVAGTTQGGLDGNTLTGTYDYFLTKYDASGTKIYTKQMGVWSAAALALSVVTDTSGNVYVAGYTTGGLDGNTLTGVEDFFLTKYDASGTKIYTKQMGVTGKHTYGYSVAIDTSGNIYVAGYTTGGLDGNTVTGYYDFFITKYDASGTKIYTKQMGVAGKTTQGRSVATDTSGNVYITGETDGGLDGNTWSGGVDLFLTKYDVSGNKIYTKQMGVPGTSTFGMSVAINASGYVYVAGWTTGGLDGNTLTGASDYFLTKFDNAGNKLFTKQAGVAGVFTSGDSDAIDADGNVYVAGYTMGGLDGYTLTGHSDLFVAKYDGNGVKQ